MYHGTDFHQLNSNNTAQSDWTLILVTIIDFPQKIAADQKGEEENNAKASKCFDNKNKEDDFNINKNENENAEQENKGKDQEYKKSFA